MIVRGSCTVYLFSRMAAAASSAFDRLFSLFGIPSIRRKTPRNRRSTGKLWRFSLVSRALDQTLALNYTASRALSSVRRSFSISFFSPPTFFSAQSHYGWDLHDSSFRSCSSCLCLTGPVLPQDRCFLGPVVARSSVDHTVEKRPLHSRELRSSISSGFIMPL